MPIVAASFLAVPVALLACFPVASAAPACHAVPGVPVPNPWGAGSRLYDVTVFAGSVRDSAVDQAGAQCDATVAFVGSPGSPVAFATARADATCEWLAGAPRCPW